MLNFSIFTKLFQEKKISRSLRLILRNSCYFVPDYVRSELKSHDSQNNIKLTDCSDEELLEEYIINRELFLSVSPSPLFNTKLYLEKHPELLQSNINPLLNYLLDDSDVSNYCSESVLQEKQKRMAYEKNNNPIKTDSDSIQVPVFSIPEQNLNLGIKPNTNTNTNPVYKDTNDNISAFNSNYNNDSYSAHDSNSTSFSTFTSDSHLHPVCISSNKTTDSRGKLTSDLLKDDKYNDDERYDDKTRYNDKEVEAVKSNSICNVHSGSTINSTNDRCIYTCYLRDESGIYPSSLINVDYFDSSWDYLCITDSKELLKLGETKGWRLVDFNAVIKNSSSVNFQKEDLHNTNKDQNKQHNSINGKDASSASSATDSIYYYNPFYLSKVKSVKYNLNFLEGYRYACWLAPDVSIVNYAFYKRCFRFLTGSFDAGILIDRRKTVNIRYLSKILNLPVTSKSFGLFSGTKVNNINFDVEFFNLGSDKVRNYMKAMMNPETITFPEIIAHHLIYPEYHLNLQKNDTTDYFAKNKLCVRKRPTVNEEDYVYTVDKHKYIDRDYLLEHLKKVIGEDLSVNGIHSKYTCDSGVSNIGITSNSDNLDKKCSDFKEGASLPLWKQVECEEIIPNERYVVKNLLVSLTTFTPRMADLVFVVYSVLRNTYLPEKVVLALSEEDFPEKDRAVPSLLIDVLSRFKEYEIIWWPKNIKSYKKLIPALSGYQDKTIITIDDDIYYNSRFIENLMMEHVMFPDTVIASRGHLITYENGLSENINADYAASDNNVQCHQTDNQMKNNIISNAKDVNNDGMENSVTADHLNFSPYSQWNLNTKQSFASNMIMPTGCGGILYPPGSLYGDVCDEDIFSELAPTCDDLWFWAMSTLNGYKKRIIRERFDLIHIDLATELGLNNLPTLMKSNYVDGNNNDIQFRRILERYPRILDILEHDVDAPFVSVIVPAYNAATMLNRCIDSILRQTLRNIEIILINDGSTDNTLDILKQYQNRDKRITVINQDNSGCNVSRNKGISIARGRFIGFVDADDMISDNYFEELYKTAVQNGADISATPNIPWLNHPGCDMKNVGLPFKNGLFNDTRSVAVRTGTVWNKIYSRDLLKRYNIHFCEIPKVIGGDNKFTFGAMMFCNRLAVNTSAVYYYHREDNSITNKKKSREDTRMFLLYKEIEAFINAGSGLTEMNKKIWLQTLIKRLNRDLGFYLNELPNDDDRDFFNNVAYTYFPELKVLRKKK